MEAIKCTYMLGHWNWWLCWAWIKNKYICIRQDCPLPCIWGVGGRREQCREPHGSLKDVFVADSWTQLSISGQLWLLIFQRRKVHFMASSFTFSFHFIERKHFHMLGQPRLQGQILISGLGVRETTQPVYLSWQLCNILKIGLEDALYNDIICIIYT